MPRNDSPAVAAVLTAMQTNLKASIRVRERVLAAGDSFRANDNIAAHVSPEDLGELRVEVEQKVGELLDALVLDVHGDENLKGTAERVARMLLEEVMNGRYVEQPRTTEFPNTRKLDELLLVGPISVRSMCSHHMVPIFGRAWIGVLPGEKLLGLSKYARLARWIMSRPQIQEESTVQLADLIDGLISPKGLGVVVKANHLCMTWRGVQDAGAEMTTSVMRGAFREVAAARAEIMALVERS